MVVAIPEDPVGATVVAVPDVPLDGTVVGEPDVPVEAIVVEVPVTPVAGMLLPVVPVAPDGVEGASVTYHWPLTSRHGVSALVSLVKLAWYSLAKFAAVGRSLLGLEFEWQVVLAVVAPAHSELASITTSASLPTVMLLPMASPVTLNTVDFNKSLQLDWADGGT